VVDLVIDATTNIDDPTNPTDVASKNYVDTRVIHHFDGHIPPLGENSSKTGFTVTASSFYSANYQPYMAFNPLLQGAVPVEWATAGETAGAWLQIQCPSQVRIWKIQLAGRRSNGERITSWKLDASNGGSFTGLMNFTVTLGAAVQEFNIDAAAAYSIYRLVVNAAEPTNTGLSVVQIFTRN
jgi:hypothetical protein